MSQEYKITKVSADKPREWPNPHGGTVYYIKVMLEGHDKPVSVGKKAPDALKPGFTVYGTIEPSDLPEDKFKAEVKPEFNSPKDGVNWEERNNSIRAQFAIKAAVQAVGTTPPPDAQVKDKTALGTYFDNVEYTARQFYQMVDRLTKPEVKATLDDDFDGPHHDADELNSLVDSEPINLDDIPF